MTGAVKKGSEVSGFQVRTPPPGQWSRNEHVVLILEVVK